ncbi:hypothetical protein GCM10023189_28920 [Nibrella saemangeumensis]|uniref:Holliday junction resolvase n=1 Tax=Nibrella saemangeumensis TaxID=1084526 RepID=A0ABP8N0S7_9BACT
MQEDEFTYLLYWSEKCSLAHKLDQFHIPPTAKRKYTIPDLFVLINDNGKEKPFFIEVKTTKKNKLSWTETYYQGLINYSELTGVPILVAWKWRSFDIWTLFELKHFKKAVSNYKIEIEKAHFENLMSKLLGDYVIIPYDEIGLHFSFKKVDVAERNEYETTWNSISEEIYITGKDGKEIKEIDSELFLFLFSFSMNDITVETDTHIVKSYVPSPDKSAFAQSVPLRLVRAFSNEEVNWLEKIKKQEYPIKYSSLLKSITQGIDKEVIRYLLHLKPKSE